MPRGGVGVEMTIADHLLHGSGRAAPPDPALALGRDAEALRRPGIPDQRMREPASGVRLKTHPGQDATIAAPAQGASAANGAGRERFAARNRCRRTLSSSANSNCTGFYRVSRGAPVACVTFPRTRARDVGPPLR
jgi:hypothetical protein